MSAEYKYNAFISYRHDTDDMKVAEHLHNAIERYHIPRSIKKSIGFDGNMDIFRDKYDLPVTDSLNDTIATALRESEYLIVICSTHLTESIWVEKEIELFLQTHPRENILTVLVDGEPNEVIPDILLYEETEEITEDGERIITRRDLEPLSADYREGIKKSSKTELPRLVAGLLGCTYEDLMLRQQKYKTRMMASIGFGIICLALIASTYILWSSRRINDNYKRALFNQSEYYSEESVRVKEAEENLELAIQLALLAVPQPDNDMPYNPHAHYALSNAVEPYAFPSGDKYFGVYCFEGEQGEKFDKSTVSKNRRYLAATTEAYGERQFLYLWDVEEKKLIARHLLDDSDAYYHANLFFSQNELWVILPYSIKIYSMSDGSIKKEIIVDDINSYKPGISKPYWNDKKLYFIFNNEIYICDLALLEITSNITIDDLNLEEATEFIVSPDNRYMALRYWGSTNDGNADKLTVIDLESTKVMFKKDIVEKGRTWIEDMCFWHDNIVLGIWVHTGSSDFNDDHNVTIYNRKGYKTEVMSINCSTGKRNWKVSSGELMPTILTNGTFSVQTRNLNVFGTDKYEETIVIVDNNHVSFLLPQTGELMQEERLPCKELILSRDSTYEKEKCLLVYGHYEKILTELYLNNNDSTTVLSKNSWKLKKSEDDLTIHGGLSDDFLIVRYEDEIIQYKKGDGQPKCTMLDDDLLSFDIRDWFAFDDYVAIVDRPEVSKRIDDAILEIRLYDLKKKKLYDTVPFDERHFHFKGVVDHRYLFFTSEYGSDLYKYDIKTKKIEKLDISEENEKYSYRAIGGQIINNKLTLLIEYSTKNSFELYNAVYQISDGTLKEPSKRIKWGFDPLITAIEMNSTGMLVYLENYNKEHAIACLDTGKLISLEDVITGECDLVQFNNRQVLFYNEKKILVFDTDKEKIIVEIDNPDIASLSMTDEYLYCLGTNSKLSRISLKDGSRKSVLLNKYNKYKSINLRAINKYEKDYWIFDDETIRIILSDINDDSIMLEIDKDTLELTGQYDNIFMYNKDFNSYFSKVVDENISNFNRLFKIGMYPCYSLDELIEKGKTLIDNKEMSENKKMRYGID